MSEISDNTKDTLFEDNLDQKLNFEEQIEQEKDKKKWLAKEKRVWNQQK